MGSIGWLAFAKTAQDRIAGRHYRDVALKNGEEALAKLKNTNEWHLGYPNLLDTETGLFVVEKAVRKTENQGQLDAIIVQKIWDDVLNEICRQVYRDIEDVEKKLQPLIRDKKNLKKAAECLRKYL